MLILGIGVFLCVERATHGSDEGILCSVQRYDQEGG